MHECTLLDLISIFFPFKSKSIKHKPYRTQVQKVFASNHMFLLTDRKIFANMWGENPLC